MKKHTSNVALHFLIALHYFQHSIFRKLYLFKRISIVSLCGSNVRVISLPEASKSWYKCLLVDKSLVEGCAGVSAESVNDGICTINRFQAIRGVPKLIYIIQQ